MPITERRSDVPDAIARIVTQSLEKEAADRPQSADELLLALAMLGALDTAAALTAFEQAVDAREIWPSLHSTFDPVYAPLWPNPRFRALLKRDGLGEIAIGGLAKH